MAGAQGMGAWLPIATAPKDVRILVWCDWMSKAYVGIFRTKRIGGAHPGWCIAFGTQSAKVEGAPTHWQPLPEPPTA